MVSMKNYVFVRNASHKVQNTKTKAQEYVENINTQFGNVKLSRAFLISLSRHLSSPIVTSRRMLFRTHIANIPRESGKNCERKNFITFSQKISFRLFEPVSDCLARQFICEKSIKISSKENWKVLLNFLPREAGEKEIWFLFHKLKTEIDSTKVNENW